MPNEPEMTNKKYPCSECEGQGTICVSCGNPAPECECEEFESQTCPECNGKGMENVADACQRAVQEAPQKEELDKNKIITLMLANKEKWQKGDTVEERIFSIIDFICLHFSSSEIVPKVSSSSA